MNSRRKGHDYERRIRKELEELGFCDCQTTRQASPLLDQAGIDVICQDLNFNVQCKAMERTGNLHRILANMPHDDKINVILHKRNNSGEIAILEKQSFMAILLLINKLLKPAAKEYFLQKAIQKQ